MNSRSKKYHESRKAGNNAREASSIPAHDGQNEKPIKQPKEDSSQPEEIAKSGSQESTASQDDTGGGHETGKRIDEN